MESLVTQNAMHASLRHMTSVGAGGEKGGGQVGAQKCLSLMEGSFRARRLLHPSKTA